MLIAEKTRLNLKDFRELVDMKRMLSSFIKKLKADR